MPLRCQSADVGKLSFPPSELFPRCRVEAQDSDTREAKKGGLRSVGVLEPLLTPFGDVGLCRCPCRRTNCGHFQFLRSSRDLTVFTFPAVAELESEKENCQMIFSTYSWTKTSEHPYCLTGNTSCFPYCSTGSTSCFNTNYIKIQLTWECERANMAPWFLYLELRVVVLKEYLRKISKMLKIQLRLNLFPLICYGTSM